MQWLRWKPTNYLQAWLLALVIGLIVIVVYLGSGQEALSIWYALSLFVVAGIVGSIRIRRLAIVRHPPQSPLS
jgi:nicotinamide riboside transporter PnuC